MVSPRQGIHEADFCAQISSQVNLLVQAGEPISPISEARIEGYGTGTERRKRKDLRFFDAHGNLILCGEVKLPGTLEGRSPYDEKLCRDAEQKAENANIRFFFTWNVNRFVLWDRSLWDRPFLERRVREWQLERTLSSPEKVAVEDNLKFIKSRFLPNLLRDVADIISERREDWSFPPDDIFIRSLESHLEWPVQLLSFYILEQSDRSKAFGARVEQWMLEHDWIFVRSQPESWIKAVDNMAKTLAYVWSNRLIFYKALLARFSNLPRLELRPAVKTAADAVAALNRLFHRAVERSGDYEPLLMPEARDWATSLVFQPPKAIDAWRGLLSNVAAIDFSAVPSDVVGRIFQKLIGPEERHRFGQHFTGDDVVDMINGFCIREAQDAVFDPACGSGSFLVRAYYRKRTLDPMRAHLELISELFGCDIALYPAHLATLNIAARQINDEANYPKIVRKDFFDIDPDRPFCRIPDQPPKQRDVMLPRLDVIVGNPPYVRQEKIEKEHKEHYSAMASKAWPDLKLSGRSDLHCYFWPVATRLLKPDGYFGFLTSSSWLDVEYGFELQGWILRHFCILAIMESASEPWFEDARVKTCITILQRCEDEADRMANKVRFVRFNRELANILGPREEVLRQEATDALRQRILGVEENYQDQDLRIIIKTQKELWEDGIRASTILASGQDALLSGEPDEEDATQAKPQKKFQIRASPRAQEGLQAKYCAGKWGRYLRAPDFYFEVIRRFGKRFIPLGEIADIRFGVKSGCDAFFMPKDVTRRILVSFTDEREFRRQTGGAPRKEVEAGRLKIIEAGDGSVHPIESEYLAPELHSLMKVDRPVVRAADLDRVVLLVSEPMDKLKKKSPWVWRYLRYGSEATFESSKSGPVPLPKRSTCAARKPWYNLTGLGRPGIAFWPMAQKYRHIVPVNPERLICNHNLFDLSAPNLAPLEQEALCAILNSTIIGLFKAFYGRFAGTETTLKTEVVDVGFIEIPDPRGIAARLAHKMLSAFEKMKRRASKHLLDEEMLNCHSTEGAREIVAGQLILPNELMQKDRADLDDCVFELLGVNDLDERKQLLKALYWETALYFREGRAVELQAMENRSKSSNKRAHPIDLAEDIWDALDLEDKTPLKEWLEEQSESDVSMFIPEERPVFFPDNPLFELKTVSFGKDGKIQMDYHSKEQASFVFRVADLGLIGEVKLPSSRRGCADVLKRLNERFEKAQARIKELAESRTSDKRLQNQLVEALERWYVQGHKRSTHEPQPAD